MEPMGGCLYVCMLRPRRHLGLRQDKVLYHAVLLIHIIVYFTITHLFSCQNFNKLRLFCVVQMERRRGVRGLEQWVDHGG